MKQQRFRKRAVRAVVALLVVASAAGPVRAQDGNVLTGRAWRAASAPVIDGRLDDAAWQAAQPIGTFVQREPVEGAAPSERTEVRVVWDDAAIYVAAWLYDREPAAIVLGETRRDADLGDNDAIRILLDTYLDRQNGFVFGTTPAGIEYDGQVTREGQGGFGGDARQMRGSGGGFNLNWDGSWDVATTRDDAGWYAEFRIPFATLRYGAGGPQRWGLNVARTIRRRNEEVVWAPVPRQFDLYRVSLAGVLDGFDAPVRRTLTVTPYALGSARRDYLGAGDVGAGVDTDFDAEFGGDAKIGVTPSLALDLTVNTDFAQVEVDDEQINLTRFQLFFPEKRPFFLENAGTFSVGTPQEVELFFSRRIGIEDGVAVPIVGGGRLTGKVAGLTVGLLDIQTSDLDAPLGGSLVPSQNFSVARVLRELPNRSRIGAIGIARVNTDDVSDHNFAWAVDGRMGIGAALTLDAYGALTDSPSLDGGEHAYQLGASWTSRDWEYGATFREVGAGFNPEVGFLTRAGYRFASGRVLRHIRTPGVAWFRELRPHFSYREYFDLDGFSETRLLHLDSHFEFANGAFFQLPALNWTREGLKEPFAIPGTDVTVPAGTYDNFEWGFEYHTNRSAPISLEGGIDIGGFYSGRRAGAETTLNGRLGETLAGALRVSYYDVNLDEGHFETLLIGLRAAYSFSPSIYLQTLLQYNDQSESFSGNLRFGWLSEAGTGLFVVFNGIENTGTFERTGIPRGAVDRAVIVKFTRLLDLTR
jgi:Domain of unknown function (DUF5916)/Carbohydrate family 9 binding domain-like